MHFLKRFGLFWWDFIVGDDWVIAAGVVVALIATLLLERMNIDAWWIMPLAVAVMLLVSLLRETSKHR